LRRVPKGVSDAISDLFSQIILQEDDALCVVWDDIVDEALEVLYEVRPISGITIIRGEVDSW
jgi:hypothetical protein